MFPTLNGKKILLGITGGIAIYKACELVRLLKKNGALVKVIMTQTATEFVQPLTFEILSENKVYCEMFGGNRDNVEHISLARWADCVVIAPATANCIGKLTHGIADDLLSTTLLASCIPICLVPAMNKEMWSNLAVQDNIRILQQRNIKIFGPAFGKQACNEVGEGRMLEPFEIASLTARLLYPTLPQLQGKKIIITNGPTVEPIDSIRYISNHSSGKTGYAIAEAAAGFGAKTILVSGPTQLQAPYGIEQRNVKTATEMRDVVMDVISCHGCDIFIAVAAVADYHVEKPIKGKVKKTEEETLELKLVKNPDILTEVAQNRLAPLIVGFAAETRDILFYAKEKLRQKNLDLIVANEVGENKGFEANGNSFVVLARDGKKINLGQNSKTVLAIELMKIIANYSQGTCVST